MKIGAGNQRHEECMLSRVRDVREKGRFLLRSCQPYPLRHRETTMVRESA